MKRLGARKMISRQSIFLGMTFITI